MAYTYRFAHLLSDVVFAEIELSNVKFDRRIILPGSFSATIDVTNRVTADRAALVIPGKCLVHVYKDSDIWGSYIIWQKRIRSGRTGVQVELAGASLESWFYRRMLDQDLSFSDVDQIEIFENLIATAQTGWAPHAASANLQIVTTPGLSGITRDREYLKTDAASVGQRMEELANVDNGFEYMIRTYESGGEIVREMIWGYPAINNLNESTQFFYPGNISSYELSYDATEAATAFWARGDSVEQDGTSDSVPLMVSEPELSTEYLAGGWPHLDKVIDYSSVTSITTLEEYATWWKDNHSGLIVIPQFEVNPLDSSFSFHPNRIGSYATCTITDEYFPLNDNGSPTFSGMYRIVGIEVSPEQRSNSETIRLIIETEFDPTDLEAM